MGIAVCLACLIMLLLIIPIDIVFSLQRCPSIQRRISVGLMFGLIRLPVPSSSIGNLFRRRSRRKESKVKRRQSQLHRVIIVIKSKGFLGRLLKFISDIYKAMGIRILTLRFTLGLDDPADTGWLWAFIGPISNILANLYIPNISIEPNFISETFYIEGKGEIHVIPIRILYIVTVFLLSPITIRAVWAIMTKRHI
jgi:hypothetical protein